MEPNRTTRRSFVKTAALLGSSGLLGSTTLAAQESAPATRPVLQPDSLILFQGDSITDAGRSREEASSPNQQKALGHGYAWLTAASLLVQHPKHNLSIFNRGISGHKVFQLAERWDRDCLRLKPDILSILIGVNDIWHGLNGQYDGTVATYEKDYRALLKRTLEALPEVRLVLCEPFVLRCGAVTDRWFPEFDQYRKVARQLAEEFSAVFVPFQTMFDQAVMYAEPEHWANDGVHPSPAGAALMATAWLKAVGGL